MLYYNELSSTPENSYSNIQLACTIDPQKASFRELGIRSLMIVLLTGRDAKYPGFTGSGEMIQNK